jgi:hypothetical protein
VTTLSSSASDTTTLFTAAAVAATIMRSWGWDESDSILVQFVSGQSFTVNPTFSAAGWDVTGTLISSAGCS